MSGGGFRLDGSLLKVELVPTFHGVELRTYYGEDQYSVQKVEVGETITYKDGYITWNKADDDG